VLGRQLLIGWAMLRWEHLIGWAMLG
jgi:hypothetical protein